MSRGSRIAAVLVGTVIGVLLITYYIDAYVGNTPPAVQAATVNGETKLTLQSVPSFGHAPHPDWVTYMVMNAQHHWVHSTIFDVPANTVVHVTIYNFDGASGLRNPFWAQPRGVSGYSVGGRPRPRIYAASTSHTFAIPDLGISVPLPGVPGSAPNQCGATPCSHKTMAHQTVSFTFRTGKPGYFRWQCFVPCAAGYLNGFGGPMQTMGYMGGYLHVT